MACDINKTGEFLYNFRMKQWVAPCKGYIKILFLNNSHNLIERHFDSVLKIPGLRVMTSGATMAAACKIDRGPESRTVYRRTFNYIEYSDF